MSVLIDRLNNLPGRILLDTCVLNTIFNEGEYIFEGIIPEGNSDENFNQETRSLRKILIINKRAAFQFVVSPLSIAEIANIHDFPDREIRLRWILDVLDTWLIMIDDVMERVSMRGSVRHRFKLTPELQTLEASLIQISDFRRDPFDRLLLIQYQMANCDAFMTTDINTIWDHREALLQYNIKILRPTEFWDMIEPFSRLWI